MHSATRRSIAFLTVTGALLGCESNEDEVFTAPYRASSPKSSGSDSDGGSTSSAGGRGSSTGGAAGDTSAGSGGDTGECNPEFCPATAFTQACCLPNGAGCGVDFGFGCMPNATDAGAGGSTSVDVQCQGDPDCNNGQRCCGLRTGQAFTAVECRNQCGGSNLAIRCGNSEQCSDGEICCGTTTGTGTAVTYESIECAESCGETGQYVLCSSNDDCSDSTQCQGSTVLPSGFTVCR